MMLRTGIWFSYFTIYLVAVTPFLWWANHLKKNGDEEIYHRFVHRIAQNWSKRLLYLAGGEVEVCGLENIPEDEPVLFVANHQGNFDIPALLAFTNRKIGFISKMEIKKLPVIRSWMTHLDCVFLDRTDRRGAVQSIIEGADGLKNGRSLVIFPEGTRSKGGPVLSFKSGSFKLATTSKATIVPVAVNGTYRLMEANHNKICPARASMTFLEPIRIHQEDDAVTMNELAERSRSVITSEIEKVKMHEKPS